MNSQNNLNEILKKKLFPYDDVKKNSLWRNALEMK